MSEGTPADNFCPAANHLGPNRVQHVVESESGTSGGRSAGLRWAVRTAWFLVLLLAVAIVVTLLRGDG